MVQILQVPREIKNVHNATKMKVNNGEIKFQDVSFNYKKTRKIFDKFNLVIKPGEKVEEGSHKQLLCKRNGLYRKLWNIQAGGFIE